jgi:tRNA(Arg) A34 adenosine deaminase TadA
MAKDIKFLHAAWKVASQSNHGVPMGAVIVVGNRLISTGFNINKSHPKQKVYFNPKREIHAELAVMLRCPESLLAGSTLYIVRKDKAVNSRIVLLAKPCPVCYEAIVEAGIEKVVYSIAGDLDRGAIHYGVIRVREWTL